VFFAEFLHETRVIIWLSVNWY